MMYVTNYINSKTNEHGTKKKKSHIFKHNNIKTYATILQALKVIKKKSKVINKI